MRMQTATALMFIVAVIAIIGWATYEPRGYTQAKSPMAMDIEKCNEHYRGDKRLAKLCATVMGAW